jgi:LacI family transcriptional regulator
VSAAGDRARGPYTHGVGKALGTGAAGRSEDHPRSAGPARLADVALAAGVSVATVSNVLNWPGKVGAATTERVRQAMEALDYVPHEGAVRLRRGSSRSIGLVLPDVANAFYAHMARGAADAAFDHRYTLILCDSADDAEREEGYLAMLAEQRAAGAVVAPLGADTARLLRLRRRGVRLAVVDRAEPTTQSCSVSVDDVRGGRLAVEHLLALGHRDIALVNGALSIRQCADRYEGARRAVATCPDARLRQVNVDTMDAESGRGAVAALTGADAPTAVFGTNDQLAIGVTQALLGRGRRVPDDVAVVGYGDLEIAPYAPVPLTTVAQPVYELGRAAVELMLDEIDQGDRHVHRSRVFAPELVVRQSAPGPG